MLYPSVSDTADQSFRLARISEIATLLTKEIEIRRRIQKKYQRAINIAQGVSSGGNIIALWMEGVGLGLSGIAFNPGTILSGMAAGAVLANYACDRIERRCALKSLKHAAVKMRYQNSVRCINL
jgi:hypothetical protein